MNLWIWSRLSIRTRLTAVIGLILVAAFLTTNLISFRVSSSALRHTILENELPLTSSNIYSEIQTDLLRPILVSSLMANDTFLKDWLLGGEKNEDSIKRYLSSIKDKYGVFTSYLISEKTLAYYHFTGRSRFIDRSDPADAWFFREEKLTHPYEVNVDVNQEQNGATTIFINYRVFDYQGKFIGVTGVGLNLNSVSQIMSRYQQKYERDIYFVNSAGKIIVRSSGADLPGDNILTAPGISTIGSKVLSTDEGYFEYRRDGENMLLTTRSIPDLGWHVIVEQRESDAFRSLWTGFLTNIVVGLFSIAVTILIVGYAVNIYQRRLEHLAVTDRLTGIGNRQMFEHALDGAISQARKGSRSYGLILFDLDRFKDINDSLGHLKGDDVIRQVAMLAKRSLRSSNILCRWGGEEISVLLTGCTLEAALDVAERLRATIGSEPLFGDSDRRVTISVGVTMLRRDDTAQSALHRVDAALYRAKAAGRNCVKTDLPEDDRLTEVV